MDSEGGTLQIAVWQAASTPADVDANLQALDGAAARAKAQGSDVLIAPEMYITGYNIGAEIERLAAHQPLERVAEIAARHRIAVIVGGPERLDSGAVANAAWMIDDAGHVLARHRKIQLFGDLDRACFVPGDERVTLAEYRGVKIALLICFDVEYPEATRAAALAGADFIAVPTAQMAPFGFVNEHMIRVRAWENSVYVAYANQIGLDGEYNYVGTSVIASPFGEHLAQASAEQEQLLTASIDLATVTQARAQNPYLQEVRSEFFSSA